MRTASLWICSLVVGCGSVTAGTDAPIEPSDAAIDAAVFSIGGTVTGFAGAGLVLRLNGGNDLTITGDGAFSFPGTFPDGASYLVTIGGQPVCPQRFCSITNGAGTLAGASPSITVTCAMPRYRLISHNWGSPANLRVTDDVLALPHNATATPRVVTGAATTLANSEIDSVVVDRMRNLVYAPARTTVPDLAVLVFANAATTTGNVAPSRRFTIAGETSFEGVELDEGADRMYLSGASGKLYVLASASTLTGVVTPTAEIALTSPGAIALDRRNDRLYVAAETTSLYSFDGARQLSSTSTPTRTVTWTAPADFPRSVAIDGCRNRLYLGFRNATTAGVNVFVFNGASMLGGAIDPATASVARLAVPGAQIMSSVLDSAGHFYFWKDSATLVNIINAPHSLSGDVTVVPDKVVNAVVDRGYGLDVVPYPP